MSRPPSDASGVAPVVDKRTLRRTEQDYDQRALFFLRTHVYGEFGESYSLAASSHIDSACWVGSAAATGNNGLPMVYSIRVFKEDESIHGSLLREICALAAIDKSGSDEKLIPRLIDQGSTETGLRFSLSTLTGRPLAVALRQFPAPFKAATARRVALFLARALLYVHGAGVVHGNVCAQAVLISNGLSSDQGNVRLGCFYYSSTKKNKEKINYPLNMYTSRAVHKGEQATEMTDLEGLLFLAYHLFIGVPWAAAKTAKEIEQAKIKFFSSLGDGKWDRQPEAMLDLAEKIRDGKSVDLIAIEKSLASDGSAEKAIVFEWDGMKEGVQQGPTRVEPGFFYEKKKDDTKQRIGQLKKAVGPDR